MNYIKHLNSAFEKFYFHVRLNPSHNSLYMTFSQEWNSSRFAREFFVNRRDLMNVAKIGNPPIIGVLLIWINGAISITFLLTILTRAVK